MRLIDADALIVSECRQCDGDCHCFDGQKCLECNSHNKCQLREAIDYADTIDAVPVVRCKECCYNYGLVSGAGWCKDDIVCEYHMSDGFADNDFCSHGVKMDGEAE